MESEQVMEETESEENPLKTDDSTEDNTLLDELEVEEFTLEGEPEVGENPLETESNPLEDPGDLDPFYDEGEGVTIAVDEDTNGFLEKVNSGKFMTEIHSFPEVKKRGVRGPYKKRNQDEDYDPLSVEQSVPPKKRSRGKFQLKCNTCESPFETIGELKFHKFSNYDNQPRPNYLDYSEVLLAKYTKRGGITLRKILTVGKNKFYVINIYHLF